MESKESEFENPEGSVWVMAVDHKGYLSILKAPNIDPGFFASNDMEEIGWPEQICDTSAGVYRIVAEFYESRCWETNIIDDWGFNFKEMEPLYLV